MESNNNQKNIFTVYRGTVINQTESTDITTLVGNEIAVFTKTGNAFSLIQRALHIQTKGVLVTTDMLATVADVIKQSSALWNIRVIPRASDQSNFSLFNYFPLSTVVKAAIGARLINYFPWVPSLFALITMGLLAFLLPVFLTSISLGYTLAVIASMCIWLVAYNLDLRRGSHGAVVLSAINTRNKESCFEKFAEKIADSLTLYMPAVIIVEDLSKLDLVSKKILELLLYAPKKSAVGALLWIAFQKENVMGNEQLLEGVSFPVKQYTLGSLE